MESQPHNPEFRNNPENFHSCMQDLTVTAITTAEKLALLKVVDVYT